MMNSKNVTANTAVNTAIRRRRNDDSCLICFTGAEKIKFVAVFLNKVC